MVTTIKAQVHQYIVFTEPRLKDRLVKKKLYFLFEFILKRFESHLLIMRYCCFMDRYP